MWLINNFCLRYLERAGNDLRRTSGGGSGIQMGLCSDNGSKIRKNGISWPTKSADLS